MPERPIWLSGAAERPIPGGEAAAMPEGVSIGMPTALPPSKGGADVILGGDEIGGTEAAGVVVGAVAFTNP